GQSRAKGRDQPARSGLTQAQDDERQDSDQNGLHHDQAARPADRGGQVTAQVEQPGGAGPTVGGGAEGGVRGAAVDEFPAGRQVTPQVGVARREGGEEEREQKNKQPGGRGPD